MGSARALRRNDASAVLAAWLISDFHSLQSHSLLAFMGRGGNVLCLASRDRRSEGNTRRALGEIVVITWEEEEGDTNCCMNQLWRPSRLATVCGHTLSNSPACKAGSQGEAALAELVAAHGGRPLQS